LGGIWPFETVRSFVGQNRLKIPRRAQAAFRLARTMAPQHFDSIPNALVFEEKPEQWEKTW
jgi:hypothetical protein